MLFINIFGLIRKRVFPLSGTEGMLWECLKKQGKLHPNMELPIGRLFLPFIKKGITEEL